MVPRAPASHISSCRLQHSAAVRPLELFTNQQLQAAIIIILVEVRKGNNRKNNILQISSGHKVISEIAESSDRHSVWCIADITHIISPSLDIMIGNTNTISYICINYLEIFKFVYRNKNKELNFQSILNVNKSIPESKQGLKKSSPVKYQ